MGQCTSFSSCIFLFCMSRAQGGNQEGKRMLTRVEFWQLAMMMNEPLNGWELVNYICDTVPSKLNILNLAR